MTIRQLKGGWPKGRGNETDVCAGSVQILRYGRPSRDRAHAFSLGSQNRKGAPRNSDSHMWPKKKKKNFPNFSFFRNETTGRRKK